MHNNFANAGHKACEYETKRCFTMATSNKTVVPEAREALNRFKMEAANEVGVNLKQGYNGDLTSRQAGSVGGQMVKKMCPERLLSLFKYFSVTSPVNILTSRRICPSSGVIKILSI